MLFLLWLEGRTCHPLEPLSFSLRVILECTWVISIEWYCSESPIPFVLYSKRSVQISPVFIVCHMSDLLVLSSHISSSCWIFNHHVGRWFLVYVYHLNHNSNHSIAVTVHQISDIFNGFYALGLTGFLFIPHVFLTIQTSSVQLLCLCMGLNICECTANYGCSSVAFG